MLVGLTTGVCQRIAIAVLGVAGGKLRLGIDAPKAVPIHRGEVCERIREPVKSTAD